MAGSNTSQPIKMEDKMSKLVEMTAQMNRMQMELDQVKASRTPAPPLPEGEGIELHDSETLHPIFLYSKTSFCPLPRWKGNRRNLNDKGSNQTRPQ